MLVGRADCALELVEAVGARLVLGRRLKAPEVPPELEFVLAAHPGEGLVEVIGRIELEPVVDLAVLDAKRRERIRGREAHARGGVSVGFQADCGSEALLGGVVPALPCPAESEHRVNQKGRLHYPVMVAPEVLRPLEIRAQAVVEWPRQSRAVLPVLVLKTVEVRQTVIGCKSVVDLQAPDIVGEIACVDEGVVADQPPDVGLRNRRQHL